MRINKILNSLNSKQLEAVKMARVPVLMLAGPGTGKTRTLIARILYQIHNFEILAEQILALTFSNKASQEMNFRLDKVLSDKTGKVHTSTIHSFCLDILRKYHHVAGLDKYFSICNQQYQTNLLNTLITEKTRSGTDNIVNGVRSAIDQHLICGKPLPPFSALIYEQYNAYLQKHKLLDFNQVLVKTHNLFLSNKDIRNQYSFLFQAVHVDEFQDTDLIQYEIIKLLAHKHKNIFVVADDDQSIYAWRGANPENINNFIKDFNIEKPVYLDINYRSGQNIIDTASSIVKNTERIEPNKMLKAGGLVNDNVDIRFFDNEEQELEYIAGKINLWLNGKEIPPAEIAVLYPQHRFAEKLTLKMVLEKIPFQQAIGHNFSDDPKMKKVLLYLQLIRDPLDVLILQELVEMELGYNAHKQIQNLQAVLKTNYRKALYELSNRPESNEELKRLLHGFIGNLANLINLKSFYNFEQLLHLILNGFQDFDKGYIIEKTLHFSDFKIPQNLNLLDQDRHIRLFHDDEKLSFLAKKMLEQLHQKVSLLEEKKIAEVSKKDIILSFTKVPFKTNQTPFEISQFENKKRESPFSTLIRILQENLSGKESVFNNYVVFDLETTGNNTDKCGIMEIAAVKVKNKIITGTFQALINPQIPVEKEAWEVHHISDEDVHDKPLLKDVWQDFKDFIADEIIIAHNGYAFDFRIIDRYSQQIDGFKLKNVRYDSLILARQMYPNDHNSIDALAEKFKLNPGNRHRALDDVKVLHLIFQEVLTAFRNKQKKTSADFLFEYVALANYLQNKLYTFEDQVFFFAGIQKLLSPFSEIMDAFCEEFNLNKEVLIAELRSKAREINPETEFYNHKDDFKIKLFKLASAFSALNIDRAIAEFLSAIMLINPQDNLTALNAVSLLTFHSAKGLEFKKVIIMGMEDESMPSYHAYKEDDSDDRTRAKKIDEQKRLLYVGLTRAKEEVILTAVKNRFGRIQKSSPFLREILNYIKENM